MQKARLIAGGILTLAIAGCLVVGGHSLSQKAAKPSNTISTTTTSTANTTATSFNKQQYSLTDPTSIWVIANKTHPLNPKTYAPNLVVPTIPMRSNITGDERQVGKVMAGPLETMVNAAAAQGIHLNLQSGYRSYSFQVSLYNAYVRQQGQAAADTQSARPGYSEHQTGLAADLGGTTSPACNVAQCFDQTIEGKWLAANAYKYGFIIRYPADKEGVTGYEYEPWHVRYVGVDLATEMHKQGIETLEEFFGVSGGKVYK